MSTPSPLSGRIPLLDEGGQLPPAYVQALLDRIAALEQRVAALEASA